ncbi:MAG: hypothetical protein J7K51_11265 [Thermotogae bacterium]|nr:hypothetical protein [Thermotogota bacterium]
MKAIVWKETRIFMHEKAKLITLILVSLFIIFINPFLPGREGTFSLISPLVPTLLGICIFSPVVFQTERYSRTLGSLLASPLSVQDIILGKCGAVFLFSYSITLLTSIPVLAVMGTGFLMGILMLLITTPIWGFVLIEIFCIAYATIKNPMVLQYLAMFITIGIVITMMNNGVTSIDIHIFLILNSIGIVLIFLLYVLMGRINKEKMMRIIS